MKQMQTAAGATLVLLVSVGLCQVVYGREVDVRPGYLKPHCGGPCNLKFVTAETAQDCAEQCAKTPECKSAIFRTSDGECSMKKYRLFHPDMKTAEDPEQLHVGIRILQSSVASPSPESPSPAPKPVPSPSPFAGGSTGTGICDDPEVKASYTYQNEVRAKNGAAPLECDEEISKIALAWSQEMCRTNTFEHGTSGMAENIAYWYGYDQHGLGVAKMWEGSEGHFANMVNPGFTKIGLGYVKCPDGQWDRVYWTENFQ